MTPWLLEILLRVVGRPVAMTRSPSLFDRSSYVICAPSRTANTPPSVGPTKNVNVRPAKAGFALAQRRSSIRSPRSRARRRQCDRARQRWSVWPAAMSRRMECSRSARRGRSPTTARIGCRARTLWCRRSGRVRRTARPLSTGRRWRPPGKRGRPPPPSLPRSTARTTTRPSPARSRPVSPPVPAGCPRRSTTTRRYVSVRSRRRRIRAPVSGGRERRSGSCGPRRRRPGGLVRRASRERDGDDQANEEFSRTGRV